MIYPMAKYKKQIEEMMEAHKNIFNAFRELHDKYAADPKKWQEQYNEEGREVMVLLRRWENNLCSKSESGRYGKFSDKLADKFWNEIRTIFPKIDYIGVQQ